MVLFTILFIYLSEQLKACRDVEKDEHVEAEMNHNFEADLYLEKLEQENERVCNQ